MQSCSTVLFRHKNVKYSHSYTLDFADPIPPHTQDGWGFVLVKCGELTYITGDNSFDVKPGNLVISAPGEIHSLHPKGPIIYDRHALVAPVDCINKDIMEQIPKDQYVLDVSNNPIILDIFDKMYFYVSNLLPKDAASVLRSIANELVTNIYIATRNPSSPAEPMTSPLIVRLLNYINEHIREPLTVPQLSKVMSVSSGYLHQHFVKHMNMTPKQYIIRQKLQLAQQALKNNANPTEICRLYGFHSYSTFYRNYQKVYGCSPSDISQNNLPKIEL